MGQVTDMFGIFLILILAGPWLSHADTEIRVSKCSQRSQSAKQFYTIEGTHNVFDLANILSK